MFDIEKTKKETTETEKYITEIIAVLITVIILPLVDFLVSYLGGFIIKWLIGNVLIQGFALFGFILPIEEIPLVCGTLGFIGCYFKTAIDIDTEK